MNISILGAGSLGSVIGGRLAQAGHDVVLINRNDAFVQAVNADGLVLLEGGTRDVVRLRAARTPKGLPPTDLLIVLVKCMHTTSALGDALHLVGPKTTVLSLQNGIGHEEVLAELTGAEHVIAGKTYVGGVMTAPGVVTAGTRGKQTLIGEMSGEVTPRILAIAKAFNGAGLETVATANIRGAMWDKLFVNVATGALSGITGLNYGNLYDLPELADIATRAVAEAMAVAAALGIAFETKHPSDAWARAGAGLSFGFKASILQSLEKGAVTEIDYINGAVVRAGGRLGVPTPVNATLVACIKGIERSLHPHAETRPGQTGNQ